MTGFPRMVRASTVSILALGSPHGDDQVAWRVADRLRRDPAYSDVVFSLDSPYQLLAHFAPDKATILIDACQTGKRPGTIVSVSENRLDSLRSSGVSSHGGSVGEMIRLAEVLGRKPSKLKILAMELGACVPAGEMSAAVFSSIEQMEQEVRREIMRFMPDQILKIG